MSAAADRDAADARLILAFLGLHPDRRRMLVDRYGGAGGAVAAAKRGIIDGIDREQVESASRCRSSVSAAGCRTVMLGEADYPATLADIEDPPDVLFVRGELSERPAIAVVGTRRCTAYGTRIARSYGRAIADAGWVLVSGLARGVDAAAHTGTVERGGVGVAVLGSGPDVVYPREHRSLLDSLVASKGAMVTEYPPGTPPNGWRFPPRNRIISALSAAVVVVEAAVTGGALVTAARAIAQGRAVFAVPGDIDREASEGCNRLIRDGAIPVFGPDDLVEGLSLVVGPAIQPAGLEPPVVHDAVDGSGVDEPELVGPAGTTLDALGARLGMGGPALLSLIGRMEIDGKIRRDGDVILPGH